MPSVYDELNTINADQIRNGLSPLVQLGQNKVQIAALQLKRQQELQDQAQKNLFTQQLLDRQQQFQTLRDTAQHREQLGYLREQSKLIGERQAADDERAYRKQVEAEAFRYGVETKGKTPEDINKEVDQKIASNVRSDLEKRQNVADQLVKTIQQSSAAAKEWIRNKALNDPNLLAAMAPDTIQKLRDRKTTIENIVATLYKDAWTKRGGVKDSTAAFNAYALAIKAATDENKTLNQDVPNAIRIQNLNNDLQLLDKTITEDSSRIRNRDLLKGLFESKTPTGTAPASPVNQLNTVPNPLGGFPLSVPQGENPLQGLGLPPTRPLSNAQQLPPPVSRVGAVIPAQQGGPYGATGVVNPLSTGGKFPMVDAFGNIVADAYGNISNTVGGAAQIAGDTAQNVQESIKNNPYFRSFIYDYNPSELQPPTQP